MARHLFTMTRRHFLAAATSAVLIGPAVAQPLVNDPYRRVLPGPAPGDKTDIWTLAFEYIPPRILTVDIPGQGKKPVWYMPYRIYNRNIEPQGGYAANPSRTPIQVTSLRFELHAKDLGMVFLDEPQPVVFDQIRVKEDPDKTRNFQTTIGVSKEKIPLTDRDSFPRYVYGLAIWTDVPAKAGKTNKFSVYVTGLSDGLTAELQPDGSRDVRVKTLQLDFFKPTDDISTGIADVRPEDNQGLGGEKWVYRTAVKRPAAKKDEK